MAGEADRAVTAVAEAAGGVGAVWGGGVVAQVAVTEGPGMALVADEGSQACLEAALAAVATRLRHLHRGAGNDQP